MKKLAVILLVLAALLGGLALYQHKTAPQAEKLSLTVYCAAGLRAPVEAAAEQYRFETGVEIHPQFGGSGTLLSSLRAAQQGDLYIAADEGAVSDARKANLIQEVFPVAIQRPVVVVRKGNPKHLKSFDDLLRPDVKVALANPEAASISRVARAALGDTWKKLVAHVTVMKPTVTEIAGDVNLGTVDAGIIWDSIVGQFKNTEAIDIPDLSKHQENASACVLAFSKQPTAALRFARYLTAPDKGGAIFKENGFTPAGGDKWSAKPSLILYSGGVNRPAIEGLLKTFEEREGINLTTVFNGCGILCASMKTMGGTSNPKFPDAYYACDICFVPPVADVFPEAVILTQTDIGIAVRKGNPHDVKTLADLAQPGLKVGLCNAEQATLGYMTRGMLKSSGLYDSIHKNVVVETPTADLLVNQMRAGALDAAIVYRVNFQPAADFLEYFPIAHEGAHAVQPFAVRHDSPNRYLGERLLTFLKSNRAQFEQSGFVWRGEETALHSKDIVIPDWLKEK